MQLCLKPNNNSIAHHCVIPRLHSVIDISYNHPLPGSAHVAVSLDSMVRRAQLHLRPQVESRAKQGLQSACDIRMEACCNFIIHQVYLVYLLDPFRALGKKAQKPSRTPLQQKKNGLQVGNSIETYIPFQPPISSSCAQMLPENRANSEVHCKGLDTAEEAARNTRLKRLLGGADSPAPVASWKKMVLESKYQILDLPFDSDLCINSLSKWFFRQLHQGNPIHLCIGCIHFTLTDL